MRTTQDIKQYFQDYINAHSTGNYSLVGKHKRVISTNTGAGRLPKNPRTSFKILRKNENKKNNTGQ